MVLSPWPTHCWRAPETFQELSKTLRPQANAGNGAQVPPPAVWPPPRPPAQAPLLVHLPVLVVGAGQLLPQRRGQMPSTLGPSCLEKARARLWPSGLSMTLTPPWPRAVWTCTQSSIRKGTGKGLCLGRRLGACSPRRWWERRPRTERRAQPNLRLLSISVSSDFPSTGKGVTKKGGDWDSGGLSESLPSLKGHSEGAGMPSVWGGQPPFPSRRLPAPPLGIQLTRRKERAAPQGSLPTLPGHSPVQPRLPGSAHTLRAAGLIASLSLFIMSRWSSNTRHLRSASNKEASDQNNQTGTKAICRKQGLCRERS